MNKLQALPEHRLDSVRRERVRVSPGSLVTVHRNYYSVHSRLIGEMVEARVLPDTVEIWYADRKVEELPRLRGRGKHRVDYRHIIDWLVRKPGAFENYRYRSDLFPTSWFRLVYDALREEQGSKRGAREYVAILLLAARSGEDRVERAVRFLLGSRQILSAEQTARLIEENTPAPLSAITIDPVCLSVFDELLTREDRAGTVILEFVVCVYVAWRAIDALLTTNRYPSPNTKSFGVLVAWIVLIIALFFAIGAGLNVGIDLTKVPR